MSQSLYDIRYFQESDGAADGMNIPSEEENIPLENETVVARVSDSLRVCSIKSKPVSLFYVHT